MRAREKDLSECDDEELDPDSFFSHVKGEVNIAVSALRDAGLTSAVATQCLLALLSAVLLTSYEDHPSMTKAAHRIAAAAEGIG